MHALVILRDFELIILKMTPGKGANVGHENLTRDFECKA